MKKLLTVIGFVLVLIGASVAGSLAGVKTIKPYEFKPYQSDSPHRIWPTFISSAVTGSVYFYAVVKLPVGKRIQKLAYYHRGFLSTSYTTVYLARHKVGNDHDILASTNSSDNTGSLILLEKEIPKDVAKIKKGYTYFVQATSTNTGSQIEGVKITYK